MPTKKKVVKATKATAEKVSKVVKNPILEDETVEEENEALEEVDEAAAMESEVIAQQVSKIPAKEQSVPAVPVAQPAVVDLNKFHQDNVALTREKLMNGPKTFFVVPLAPGEKVGASETVNINGWKLTIKKGALVEIPIAVMKILANYYKVSIEAGQDKLIDRAEKHDGISMESALN